MEKLLLGKTFTVDPITKQRLDNTGEEKYYIKDYQEQKSGVALYKIQ